MQEAGCEKIKIHELGKFSTEELMMEILERENFLGLNKGLKENYINWDDFRAVLKTDII